MSHRAKTGAAIAAAVLLVGGYSGAAALSSSSSKPSTSSTPSAVVQRPQHGCQAPFCHLEPLKTAGCTAQAAGQLPDPACTPGVVDPALTVKDLCPHLHATVVRAVTDATKRKVRAAYGDQRPGEIDHLVSLELGGSNDPANLWPEDGKIPNPKDAVEDRLHREVCAGTISLVSAQQSIATDWRTAR